MADKIIKGYVGNEYLDKIINEGGHEVNLGLSIYDDGELRFMHVQLDDVMKCATFMGFDVQPSENLVTVTPRFDDMVSSFIMKQIWKLVKPNIIELIKEKYGDKTDVVFGGGDYKFMNFMLNYIDGNTIPDLSGVDLLPGYADEKDCVELIQFVKLAGLETELDTYLCHLNKLLQLTTLNSDNVCLYTCILMNLSYMVKSKYRNGLEDTVTKLINYLSSNSITDDDMNMINDHYREIYMALRLHDMDELFTNVDNNSGLMSRIQPVLSR